MRKYRIIAIVALFLGVTQSCDESDLELVNPNTLSPETFFADENQIRSAVNAAYAQNQTNALYGRLLFYMYDNMSQENSANPQQEANKVTYKNFSFDSSNNEISEFWDSCFKGINKANFVLSNVERINELPDAVISQRLKNKYIAEARFLRAHYYFLLVTRFGGVPIFDGLPESAEGRPRNTKEEVYAFLTEDFRFAAANLLPKGEEDNGRATQGAAQAYLGKVLLYQGLFADAYDAFNAMTGYDLEDDYFDNFKEETEHGIESVFEIQYDRSLGTAAKWDSNVSGEGFNESTFRGQDYGVLDWFNAYPSDDLLDEYEDGDFRMDANFYFEGDTYNNGTGVILESDLTTAEGVRRAGWRKYQNYYRRTAEEQESSINMKVIRYSDVLLMMAEAANETNRTPEAIDLINRVRDRADLEDLPDNLSKEQVFDALVHERKVELAGEQVRFDDILRWGISNTELAGTNFQQGKHEVWPIPDREIAANDAINQEDQNPGY
ncbi:RagB/SusD family nutrient uptake outer membrane protein [Leeuwenhoekiella marinoflava]|uniref:Starch-binding associating with outer membrane n=2 Tax=Leeuwenhoekiella marinoflava TaxID=988 RepID=A0ABY1HNA5_9FLAO|nr:RagB/SusD family nutrient uptake outer membrane protein [Leeuwenhoekiella marinoflava]RXG32395.1 putative outer membrane starch-binding protein [Leeuwenhoekiella marinoflava]SHE73293.1 Starch-binding associating with outer membrane [Leeuwenhoekiella marinoflava DSM 3653]